MDACNAMQCNAIQYNTIQYIHTYIYIHISFFRGIPDLQTNQFSRLCSTDLLRGFLVLCSLEWRMCRLRRQQASGDSQVSPANGDPVFTVSSNAGHPDEACMGREHWPAKDPKCCGISWVQGMDTCPAPVCRRPVSKQATPVFDV